MAYGLRFWHYNGLAIPDFASSAINKFTPLPDGELKQKIIALANRVSFAAGGLFVMDASVRSTHGNAYFLEFSVRSELSCLIP